MADDLEEVARVLDEADTAFKEDLTLLKGVDVGELFEWTHQPDPDTDGKGH